MDNILYPYRNNIQVELVKRKKVKNINQLVLTDSLYIDLNKTFSDNYFLNDEPLKRVYKEANEINHVTDLVADDGKYIMSVDMDQRKRNMATYTSERLIILIFKKLFSINFKEKREGNLIFEKPDFINLDIIIKETEKIANEAIQAGLDTKTAFSKGRYFMKIPSLGVCYISYPVLGNLSELLALEIIDYSITDVIEIEFRSYLDVLDNYANLQEDFSNIKNLVGLSENNASIKELIEENLEMKAKIKSLREIAYSSYISKLKKTFEINGISFINHIIDDSNINELSSFVSMLDEDIAIVAKTEGEFSSFILSNKTSMNLLHLIKNISEIYKMELFTDENYLRGRIESKYLERFFDTFSKDLKNLILNK